jgi:hypothetical protein
MTRFVRRQRRQDRSRKCNSRHQGMCLHVEGIHATRTECGGDGADNCKQSIHGTPLPLVMILHTFVALAGEAPTVSR